MRTLAATRYVTPLREGGSLPAIVEAADEGLYVLKFRGAGQGPRALVAEIVAGGIARVAGLPIPEIVLLELDAELARTEPDPEIQHLIRASTGLNVALDYLPGAINFDPVVDRVEADLAARIVWFDAYVTNVDRTARNTNMLMWHRRVNLIDHGASLYFHHDWASAAEAATSPFTRIVDHVLLPAAGCIRAADAAMVERVDAAAIEQVCSEIPDALLDGDSPFASFDEHRAAYARHLTRRLACRADFVQEIERARARHV